MGESEESEAAVYEPEPDAADEVAAELCDALRDMVAFVLPPSTVWELRWSVAGFPTIMEVQTAVEWGGGVLPAIRIWAPPGQLVEQLAAVFREGVAPASLEVSTRWSSQLSGKRY